MINRPPDTQVLTFNYKDKVLMYEQRLWNTYRMNGGQNGVEVYGTGGKIVCGYFDESRRYGYRIYDEKDRLMHYELADGKEMNPHYASFVDRIRYRKTPPAEVEVGHLSTALCHLGNTAGRLKRTLRFNPETESFLDDAEANKYLTREYREHWSSKPFV